MTALTTKIADSDTRSSFSEVFPLPRWPTRATLRMRSALCMPSLLLRLDDGRPDPSDKSHEPQRVRAPSVRKARAEPQDRLGVQLRDARLGHAEDLADLAQREVLVVVEGD